MGLTNRPPETSTPAYTAGLAAAAEARRVGIRELTDLDRSKLRDPDRVQLDSMLARLVAIEADDQKPTRGTPIGPGAPAGVPARALDPTDRHTATQPPIQLEVRT